MTRWTSTVAACAALATALLTETAAAASPAGPVVATYKVNPGQYALAVSADSVWAVDVDEVHDAQVFRIDPASHRMKLVTTLSFPGGGATFAFGSIWVSDYFGNAVWRIGTDGRVQAEIATGLQPQWLHAAFGSLWVSNHHGASATRIDPITNRVQDTVQVGAPDTFRDGPQAITDDGTRLYVGSSNLQALQSVDPATDAVSTPPSIADAFCGPTEAAGGFVWSVDRCTATTYRLGTDGSVQQAIASTGMPQGLTTAGGDVWIGDDTTFDPNSGVGSSAVLDERDASTGVLLQSVPIGGDASDLASGFGSLWVYDAVASTIRRVQV